MPFKYGVLLCALYALTLAQEHFEVKFEWDVINFTWPSKEIYQDAVKNKLYIKENNHLNSIKFWKGNMYVMMRRDRVGNPVTMAVTPASPVNSNKSPLLEPYPNWDMQKIGGDCSGFQSVNDIEIDPMGRMWVPDSGSIRFTTYTYQELKCSPRLVILDLEKGGKVLMSYTFPSKVARIYSADFLNIVLDHEDGGFAYILDANEENSGLIVFSLQNFTSWRVEMTLGRASRLWLALSQVDSKDSRKLYYTSTDMSSTKLFEVSTNVLKNKILCSCQFCISQLSKKLYEMEYGWSGATMSNNGVMFLTYFDFVYTWDSKNLAFDVLEKAKASCVWIHSLTIDENGNFWVLCANQVKFMLPESEMTNYQYHENGTVPELPSITSDVPELPFTPSGASTTHRTLDTIIKSLLETIFGG